MPLRFHSLKTRTAIALSSVIVVILVINAAYRSITERIASVGELELASLIATAASAAAPTSKSRRAHFISPSAVGRTLVRLSRPRFQKLTAAATIRAWLSSTPGAHAHSSSAPRSA